MVGVVSFVGDLGPRYFLLICGAEIQTINKVFIIPQAELHGDLRRSRVPPRPGAPVGRLHVLRDGGGAGGGVRLRQAC